MSAIGRVSRVLLIMLLARAVLALLRLGGWVSILTGCVVGIVFFSLVLVRLQRRARQATPRGRTQDVVLHLLALGSGIGFWVAMYQQAESWPLVLFALFAVCVTLVAFWAPKPAAPHDFAHTFD